MSTFIDIAQEIAREAAGVLVSYAERGIGYRLKGEFDLVTEADTASDRLIVERLRTRFPSHSIVAEESGKHRTASEYCWYVDPLDGTANFAHGFPMFCVSMGLERAGRMIAGVVYEPGRDEMFAAELGAGAWLNNRRIHVSGASRLSDCLVATGFPSRKRHHNVNVHFFYQMGMASHGVRRAGSAALDLAYVACGRLDAFWEFGLNPWDLAAGVLLVTEAGGVRTGMRGEPHALSSPDLLADNGLIHEEILQLFRDVFAGRYRIPVPGLEP
ncbi:MAG: inositol monophosphatase [Bryobacterales bacterium]|nr:inositol monophosphatase [Bryobacterales bacterium]